MVNNSLQGVHIQDIFRQEDETYFVEFATVSQNGEIVWVSSHFIEQLMPRYVNTDLGVLTFFDYDMYNSPNNSQHERFFGGRVYYHNYSYFIHNVNGVEIFESNITYRITPDQTFGYSITHSEIKTGIIFYNAFESLNENPEDFGNNETRRFRFEDYNQTTMEYTGAFLDTILGYERLID